MSLTTHLIFWGAQSTTPSELVTHNHWHVLAAQQLRLFLFNVFGCYVGIEQTRQMRLNFWHVRLLAEAVQLHQLCRQRFHALTRNTLPAPIVKAIAAGDTAFVKVYEACTVLQADMVGFTPLSSKYPPERVLGILSDIFEEFDSLCESHSVDKVKTIGDAYIVCAGALARPRADDAARVVRMGMGMQEVVKRVAAKERIDIAVRIGVHTGRCTGGIIGTVRFHFDMWGGAVYGAVKMEETGEKGRVHVSDASHDLLGGRFDCTLQLSEADLGDTGRELGIRRTWLVVAEASTRPTAPALTLGEIDDDGCRHSATGGLSRKSRGRSIVGGWPRDSRAVGCAACSMAAAASIVHSVGGWVRARGPTHGNGAHSTPHSGAARMHGSTEPPRTSSTLDGEDDVVGVDDRATSNFFIGARHGHPLGGDTSPQASLARPLAPCGALHCTRASHATSVSTNASSARPSSSSRMSSMQAKALLPLRRISAYCASQSSSQRHTPREQYADDLEVEQGRQSQGSVATASQNRQHVASGRSDRTASAMTTDLTSGHGALAGGRVSGRSRHQGSAGTEGNESEERTRVIQIGATPPPPPPPTLPPPQLPAPMSCLSQARSQRHSAVGDLRPAGASLQAEVALQKAAESQSLGVRILFQESVRSALRRSAAAITLVLALFGLYDYAVWGREASLSFYLLRFLACVPAAAIPALVVVIMRRLKGQTLPLVNMLLLMGPWLCTVAMLFIAPDRSRQYMLTMAFFQVWYGYTMLSLPTAMLACLQAFLSILYCIAEYIMLDFPSLNEEYRPTLVRNPKCDVDDLSLGTTVGYLFFAQFFGIMHNRRRRRNLRNHAKLLVSQEDRMLRISEEVECCQQLLRNVFPLVVLERLQNRNNGAGSAFAEKFTDCTFLFAKIVGIKTLTELGEKGERDPGQVVAALQLIFDRFDQLADTFKVQKVRKTVNEYYMVAAGLPNPEVLPDPKERALAIVALAFAMVHVMDILNSEAVMRDVGVTLQCQVGIHSGDAIAGVIGHKRFQYDLCGDAVNTAARMCSYSAPGCINVSPNTLELVGGEYGALYRGERAVKGKGNMKLYFLTGRLHPAMRELIQPELAAASACSPQIVADAPTPVLPSEPKQDEMVNGVVDGVVYDNVVTPAPIVSKFSAIAEEPSAGAISTLAEGACSAGQSTSHLSLSPSSPGGSSAPDVAMSADSLRKLRSVDTLSPIASAETASGVCVGLRQQLQHSSSGLRVDRHSDHDHGGAMDLEAQEYGALQHDARPPLDPGGRRGSCPPPDGMPSCPHAPFSPTTSGVIAPPRLSPHSFGSRGVSFIEATPHDELGAGPCAPHQRTPLSSSLRDSGASTSSAPPTFTVDDLRDYRDPTQRALDRSKRTSSLAALGASMASLIAPPQSSSSTRRRHASVSRRWDQSSLNAAAAAAALGDIVDTGLHCCAPTTAGDTEEAAGVEGNSNPAAILRSLSVGNRPRYSCQSRAASAGAGSAASTEVESYSSPPVRDHPQAHGPGGALMRRLFGNRQRSPAPDRGGQQGQDEIVLSQLQLQQHGQQQPPPSLPPTPPPPDEPCPAPPLPPSIELSPEILDEQREHCKQQQHLGIEHSRGMRRGSLISAGL